MAKTKIEAAEAVVETEEKAVKKTAKKAASTAKKAAEKLAEAAADVVADAGEAVEKIEKNVEEAAAKKPAAKRNKKLQEDYFLEYNNFSVDIKTVTEKIQEAVKSHKDVKAETVRVYVKPQDGKAYYVINDEVLGNVDLFW